MRLLCTNDDGILAYGLECLVRAAEPLFPRLETEASDDAASA